jgi:hypothetical protein
MNADEEPIVQVPSPHPSRIPQPGWRLMGFASIGLGSGLFTAGEPMIVIAAAFVPALVALVVVAAQATAAAPVVERLSPAPDQIPDRR